MEHKNIVAYGGFKKSISGYTRNRMQNPTINFRGAYHHMDLIIQCINQMYSHYIH
jgi:hypothetical protein